MKLSKKIGEKETTIIKPLDNSNLEFKVNSKGNFWEIKFKSKGNFVNFAKFNKKDFTLKTLTDSKPNETIKLLFNRFNIFCDKYTKIKDKEKYFENFINQLANKLKLKKGKKKKETEIKKKELSAKEIKEIEKWLKLSDDERAGFIIKILNYYIVGAKEVGNALLTFFLKLGDIGGKYQSYVNYKGDSSSGKSYICDTIIKLFPIEFIYIVDSGSAKILRYDTELSPIKKIIYICEMRYNEEFIEELKNFIRKNIRFKVVEKDKETNQFITRTIEQIAKGLLTTYSFENIQQDYADRSWSIITNQSYEQTNKIIDYDLERESNKIEFDVKEQKILNDTIIIQNMIRYLPLSYDVIIPYAKSLKILFPKKSELRARRDDKKFLNLIKCITIFNQKNREIINNKYIIANFYDFKLALGLGSELFFNITQNLDTTKKEILDKLSYNTVYSLKEINDKIEQILSIHINTLRNKLKDLERKGYVSISKNGKGNKKNYEKLKDYKISNKNILTPELEQEIKEKNNEYIKKYSQN